MPYVFQTNFTIQYANISHILLENYSDCHESKNKTAPSFLHMFQAIIHKICASLNNEQYRIMKKHLLMYMCLLCQSNTFPFSEQSNFNIFLINSGFNNSLFRKDTNIFPDENLNLFFIACNSKETPFNDSDHPKYIDSKYYDIHDLNKLNINKNSSFGALHLNIASVSKHFDDSQNFLSFWNIILILLAFFNIKLINIQRILILLYRNILFTLMNPKAPTEEQVVLFLTM